MEESIKKLEIIKDFIKNFKDPKAFEAFEKTYRSKMLKWIKSNIYLPRYRCDYEDIYQEILIGLWNYNSFKNFKIGDDEKLVQIFEGYLNCCIIYRGVCNYFRKQLKSGVNCCEIYDFLTADEEDMSPLCSEIARYVSADGTEKQKPLNDYNDALEYLDNKINGGARDGGKSQNYELYKKYKVDGYSLGDLSKKYGLLPANISMKIFRAGKEMQKYKNNIF